MKEGLKLKAGAFFVLLGIVGGVISITTAPLVLAASPESPGVGQGKSKGPTSQSRKDEKGTTGISIGFYFTDAHRKIINEYFLREFKLGHCPPGLAKKNNGCLPPGQATKWRLGHPLPGGLVYDELPAGLLRELGDAPAGYRYVRVASDILLIALGTGLVADAIADLGGAF